MKMRCYYPKCNGYKNYGARGITICEDWLNSYKAFEKWALENGYDDTLTIERNNVNGNYEPSNCRWITKQEQAHNKTNTHWVLYNGKKYALEDLARTLKFDDTQFREYEKRFGSSEKALDYILKRKQPYGKCERTLCYKGEIKPLREWCDIFNLNVRTVEYRIDKYRWSVERALEEKAKPIENLISFNGETHSVKEWANITGISYCTLRGRLYSGKWSIERMLTTPQNLKLSEKVKKGIKQHGRKETGNDNGVIGMD